MLVLKFNPLNLLNKYLTAVIFCLFLILISTNLWAELSRAELWIETECPLEKLSAVTDSNGINYIVDTCGNITARNQYDIIWTYSLGERVKAQPVLNNEGSFCILTYFGTLNCFDDQGSKQWETQISLENNETCVHAPLTDSENGIFALTNQGRLFCFENNVKKWTLSLKTTGRISAVLSSKYIIVGDETGKIYFVDKSGNTKKIVYLGGLPVTRPSLSHDNVYFITNISQNYYLNTVSLDEKKIGSLLKVSIPYVPISDVTPLVDSQNRVWILTENGVIIYDNGIFDDYLISDSVLPASPVLIGDHLCFLTDDHRMNAIMPPSDPVETGVLDVYSVSSDISCDLSGNLFVSALSDNGTGQVWRYRTSWRLDSGDPWPMAGKNPAYISGEWYDYSLEFLESDPDTFTTPFFLYESDELNASNLFSDIEIILKNTGKDGLPYSLHLTGSALDDYSAWKDPNSGENMNSWEFHSTLQADEEKHFTIQCVSPLIEAGNFDLVINCSFPGTYFPSVAKTYNIEVKTIPGIVALDPSAGYASKCIINDNNLYCVSGEDLYKINQDTLSVSAWTTLPFPAEDTAEYMNELTFYTERPSLNLQEDLLYVIMGQNLAIFNADTLELVNDFSGMFKDNLHMLVDSDQSVYLAREDDKNIIHIDDIYEIIEEIKDKELEDPEPERGVFVEPLMVEKGSEKRLYVPGRDGKLTVWQDDAFLYKFQAGGALMATPVLAGCGQLLMPSWDGFLYVMGWNEDPSKPGYLENIAKINFHQPLDHSPFIIESNGISNAYMVTGKGDLFEFQLGGSHDQQSRISPIASFELPDSVSWWHSDVAYSDKTIMIAFYPAIQDSSQLLGTQLLFEFSLENRSFKKLNGVELDSGEIVLDIIESGSNSLYFITSYGKIIDFNYSETLRTNHSAEIAVFDQETEKLSIILDPGTEWHSGDTITISVVSRCFCEDETVDLNFKNSSTDFLWPSFEINRDVTIFNELPNDPWLQDEWRLEAYGKIADVFMFDKIDFTITSDPATQF